MYTFWGLPQAVISIPAAVPVYIGVQSSALTPYILLLYPFEKQYFDKEEIPSTVTGHPLLEKGEKNKIDISQIIKENKKIFSIFPGSRLSEINVLTPILIDFVKKMNEIYKYNI